MTPCALWMPWLVCGSVLMLGSACNVDRFPLQSAELTSDSGVDDSTVDAAGDVLADADLDAEDPGENVPDASTDANVTGDAGAEVPTDGGITGTDARPEVDAYVPPPRFAGSCNAGCLSDENCVRTTGLFEKRSYCAQTCRDDRDCGPAPAGAATPRCTEGLCRLPCDAVLGSGCPSQMVCVDALFILPGGNGSCAFVE